MAFVTTNIRLNMKNAATWYGILESYDASSIVIRAGDLTGTYGGSFSFDIYGNVFGTLRSYYEKVAGVVQWSATGLNANAYDVLRAIDSGDSSTAMGISLRGNDTINGSRFSDVLFGYGGSDTIRGFGGNDNLQGRSGRDTLIGDAGRDVLDGGDSRDVMRGGKGNDRYIVDRMTDKIVERAGEGKDTVIVERGHYSLGANLENLIYDGAQRFTGTGNGKNNKIVGGNKADTLIGKSGNDTLYGNGGQDRLKGGAGEDVFQINANRGDDTIVDFEDGIDRIEILLGANRFSDFTITQDGTDAVVAFGQGRNAPHVTLEDFSATDLSASDFIF